MSFEMVDVRAPVFDVARGRSVARRAGGRNSSGDAARSGYNRRQREEARAAEALSGVIEKWNFAERGRGYELFAE